MGATLNIDLYKKAYFYFDKPVEYQLKDNTILYIYPINVQDSEIFLWSMPVISIDKNSSDSVEIIQMSYLEFIYRVLLQDKTQFDRFTVILKYCLHMNSPEILWDEKGKFYLCDKELGVVINHKDFENIRRIILYQNIIRYDDEYINPDARKAMEEMDKARNMGIDPPSIERKMAIITAHCGISKQEQMAMTYRSHCLLFEEVYGEVEFTTTRPIMLYAGEGNKIDHWIYKKKRSKYDGYFTSMSEHNKNMGVGEGISLSQSSSEFVNNYLKK